MRLLYLIVMTWMLCCVNEAAFAKKKSKKVKSYTTTQRMSSPVIYGEAQLALVLNKLIVDTNSKADIGVYVKSMSDGNSLFARNINQPLTPASTLKILTAEAALIYLGPNYRFSTQLLTDAKGVQNGVLRGNLYIVLSGDPSLTYYDLEDLMIALRNQGIQKISGSVYIDNTAYDERFYGPGWVYKDKSYCYGAPISASIINHNCIPFQVAPSKVAGHPAEVKTSSKYYYPPIRNSVTTKSGRSCSMRLTTSSSSIITLDGCMSKGRVASGISYVVTDVPEYNRSLFKSVIARLGVKVYGEVTFGTAPDNLSVINTHTSQPLPLLIRDMLKKSDNIIAGALFKKIGQMYTRQPGSWENGSLAVSQILSKRAGVNTSGLRVLDGSGLSPDNLVTPAQMMQVLNYAYHNSAITEDFISALPIAGVDGTLKHRMGNIARKIRAKTGTISGVVSLAGYATSYNKEPLGFVIMINGSRGLGWRYKALEDKIATALTRYVRA